VILGCIVHHDHAGSAAIRDGLTDLHVRPAENDRYKCRFVSMTVEHPAATMVRFENGAGIGQALHRGLHSAVRA
jgi:hypothetical protein